MPGPVEDSVLIRAIWGDPGIRSRAEAIVMAHMWNTEGGDIFTSVPIDGIMWAIASNPSIQAGVRASMAAQDEANQRDIGRGVAMISDSDLSYVVLAVAWPRLVGAA